MATACVDGALMAAAVAACGPQSASARSHPHALPMAAVTADAPAGVAEASTVAGGLLAALNERLRAERENCGVEKAAATKELSAARCKDEDLRAALKARQAERAAAERAAFDAETQAQLAREALIWAERQGAIVAALAAHKDAQLAQLTECAGLLGQHLKRLEAKHQESVQKAHEGSSKLRLEVQQLQRHAAEHEAARRELEDAKREGAALRATVENARTNAIAALGERDALRRSAEEARNEREALRRESAEAQRLLAKHKEDASALRAAAESAQNASTSALAEADDLRRKLLESDRCRAGLESELRALRDAAASARAEAETARQQAEALRQDAIAARRASSRPSADGASAPDTNDGKVASALRQVEALRRDLAETRRRDVAREGEVAAALRQVEELRRDLAEGDRREVALASAASRRETSDSCLRKPVVEGTKDDIRAVVTKPGEALGFVQHADIGVRASASACSRQIVPALRAADHRDIDGGEDDAVHDTVPDGTSRELDTHTRSEPISRQCEAAGKAGKVLFATTPSSASAGMSGLATRASAAAEIAALPASHARSHLPLPGVPHRDTKPADPYKAAQGVAAQGLSAEASCQSLTAQKRPLLGSTGPGRPHLQPPQVPSQFGATAHNEECHHRSPPLQTPRTELAGFSDAGRKPLASTALVNHRALQGSDTGDPGRAPGHPRRAGSRIWGRGRSRQLLLNARPGAKRVSIRREDLAKVGYTRGCGGCNAAIEGSVARCHTEKCRARVLSDLARLGVGGYGAYTPRTRGGAACAWGEPETKVARRHDTDAPQRHYRHVQSTPETSHVPKLVVSSGREWRAKE
eukprot:TRINITY_DN4256_c0_g1_i2.p1 TRINITY_DN4256_c0_g1~~TRINITY_DN4256_c0_g1_i2.p1  ORF type:complete len:845 (-),score=163.69 TRINITY_DN4256_c0_g1_i2:44-2515(-)